MVFGWDANSFFWLLKSPVQRRGLFEGPDKEAGIKDAETGNDDQTLPQMDGFDCMQCALVHSTIHVCTDGHVRCGFYSRWTMCCGCERGRKRRSNETCCCAVPVSIPSPRDQNEMVYSQIQMK